MERWLNSDYMTEQPGGPAVSSERGLVRRLGGVIFAPRPTFAEIAEHPRWVEALLAVTLLPALVQGAFLSSAVGRQALLDQQVRTMESFGIAVTEAQYTNFERMASFAGYLQPISVFIFGSLIMMALSGAFYGAFTLFAGGRASFRQVFSVIAHGGAVTIIHQFFITPLNYVRKSMSNPATLGAFAPALDDDAFLYRLLGVIDVFIVWWIIVLAIGLAVLYRRKTGTIATVLLGVYTVIAVGIATLTSQMGGRLR